MLYVFKIMNCCNIEQTKSDRFTNLHDYYYFEFLGVIYYFVYLKFLENSYHLNNFFIRKLLPKTCRTENFKLYLTFPLKMIIYFLMIYDKFCLVIIY